MYDDHKNYLEICETHVNSFVSGNVRTMSKEWYDRGYSDYKKGFEQEIDKSYVQGAQDAWDCARSIYFNVGEGGLCNEEIVKAFGVRNPLKSLTAKEAIDKLKKYESEEQYKELSGASFSSKIEALDMLEWGGSTYVKVSDVYEAYFKAKKEED